jgi:hypothetical protein
MDERLKESLEQAREVAAQARLLLAEARRAGVAAASLARRQRELDRLEDVGRSTVLECLERGDLVQALEGARGLSAALGDEAERTARALVQARRERAGRA